MKRTMAVSLAALLISMLSGCIFVHEKGDRGLHKGHYKGRKGKGERGDPGPSRRK